MYTVQSLQTTLTIPARALRTFILQYELGGHPIENAIVLQRKQSSKHCIRAVWTGQAVLWAESHTSTIKLLDWYWLDYLPISLDNLKAITRQW